MNEEIARALAAAFPNASLKDGDLTPVAGGRSGATVLAFVVDGARFILRKKNPDALGNELECLRIASEVGVAPVVRHVDRATGICIMEHVAVKEGRAAPEDVARALRRLHDGPAFPQGPTLPEMAPMVRQYVPADVVETIDALAARLAASGRRAPCHRDLNPTNVLNAERGVLFVDWDTASQDDPYLDVAELGAFTWSEEARERIFAAYLGRAPTDGERAEMKIARVLALAFYTAASAVAAIIGGQKVTFTDDAPSLDTLFASGRPPGAEAMARAFYVAMKRERVH